MPGFEAFKELAGRELDLNARCGFGSQHRGYNETVIVSDIVTKLKHLAEPNTRTLDIGAGCSDLTVMLIELHRQKGGALTLIDSEEMLRGLPDTSSVETLTGRFPECDPPGPFDSILMYSVLHCLDTDQDPLSVCLHAANLLRHGGELLVGDIPISEKRTRFLASDFGRDFDKKWRASFQSSPAEPALAGGVGSLSEKQIFDILVALREAGFESYLLPQSNVLPFSYTRDDILIRRF